MKYLLGFLGFWRHLIFGDDSRIAVAVIWLLLFIWSLAANFINAWFVLPVAVCVLLLAIIFRETTDTFLSSEIPVRARLLLSAALPLIIVTSLPLIIFRISNNTSGLRYTLLPLSIYITLSLVLSVVLQKPYRKHPVTVAVGFIATTALLLFVEPFTLQTSQYFAANYSLMALIFAFIMPFLFIGDVFTSFVEANKR